MTYKEIRQNFIDGLRGDIQLAKQQPGKTIVKLNEVMITTDKEEYPIEDDSIGAHTAAFEDAHKNSVILGNPKFFKIDDYVQVDVEGYGNDIEILEVTDLDRCVVIAGHRYITNEEFEGLVRTFDSDDVHQHSTRNQHKFKVAFEKYIKDLLNAEVEHKTFFYINCNTLQLFKNGHITWDVFKTIVLSSC